MVTIITTSPSKTAPELGRPTFDGTLSLYRLSIDQYERMAEAGVVSKDDRIELIDGLLVQKMVKLPPHVVCAKKTLRELECLAPTGWHVAKEDPIRIPGRSSEPEPDLTVIRGEPEDYLEKNPDASAVALVVEVAESSLEFDRKVKLSIYGMAGIPIYWIVNLTDWQLEVYSEPSGEAEPSGYRGCRTLGPDDRVDLIIEGKVIGQIAVRDMLP
jgi:Uma2 family endonuclease